MSNITYKPMVTFDDEWGVYGYQAHHTGEFLCVKCSKDTFLKFEVNTDTCWAIDDEDYEGLQELECYDCSKVMCVAFVPFTRPRSLFENLPDLDLINQAMRLLVTAGQATLEWTHIHIPEESHR